MNLESAEYFLGKLSVAVTPRQINGSWSNYKCPFAPWYHEGGEDNSPSFGVSFNEEGIGRSYYRCFSCGQKGSFALLGSKLGALRKKDYSATIKEAEEVEYRAEEKVNIPEWEYDEHGKPQQKKAIKRNTNPYGTAMWHPYLRKRGYTWKDAWRLNLRYDEVQERILFPVYNNRLQLQGYTGRSTVSSARITKGDGKNPKIRDYGGLDKKSLLLFNPLYYSRNVRSPVVLVEGPFDYARGQQAGYLGTHANLGTALTYEKLSFLIRLGRPVVLLLDDDVAGRAATFGPVNNETGQHESLNTSWAHMLHKEVPVWIAQYPSSAVNRGVHDPDGLTPNEFRKAVKDARLFVGHFSYFGTDSSDPIPF